MSPEDRNTDQARPGGQHGRGARGREAPGAGQPRNALPARAILVGVLALVAVVLAVLALRPGSGSGPVATGAPAIGGPFQMVDTEGRPADESVLQGKWSAVFFGYTYCPDVCPATLTALGAAKQRLGPEAKDLQAVFVSVDPERDTPAQVKAYLESPAFPRPLVGLTGSPEQVAAIAKAYKVYYAKNGEGPDYLMDHNSAIYLMDPQGRFVRLIRPDAGPEAMAKEIGSAIGRS